MDQKMVVCVTGASGFLASWLVKRLLLSGYHVTGTVRDPGNDKKLAHLWRLEGARERLTLVRADLMEEGSFDKAIMGCHGVFHTASPVMGSAADPKIWYALSKVLAEKAAWEFCKENGIDLVTVLPSFVIGPSLPPDLCSTASDVLGLLKGETEKFKWNGRMGYVHIDDVALCHILVYEHENAHGRYLCNSAVVDNNVLASLLSARYPSLPVPKRFDALDRPYYEFNTSKLQSLGFKFKSIQEMFDDCVASLVEKGHLGQV
ncbi:tetraketide alpha-pyrone reductase 1 isoform X2 [Vitis vinifera]|uniref:tetraketide alpha-pyrone reductase 1 isoform X2 n=1 Tax=Vitis vinifera TaxID=29760 RepID=UPI0008FFC44F|nr:tetraketide alpha-pyrone reductase 1 isoform X2 [Vitis vinifera]|eukprot:XP_019074508.1 PREDICTED: tetraketide alpha-pyrone reductase 1 isoform X2 [Vitis vinifera]